MCVCVVVVVVVVQNINPQSHCFLLFSKKFLTATTTSRRRSARSGAAASPRRFPCALSGASSALRGKRARCLCCPTRPSTTASAPAPCWLSRRTTWSGRTRSSACASSTRRPSCPRPLMWICPSELMWWLKKVLFQKIYKCEMMMNYLLFSSRSAHKKNSFFSLSLPLAERQSSSVL